MGGGGFKLSEVQPTLEYLNTNKTPLYSCGNDRKLNSMTEEYADTVGKTIHDKVTFKITLI